MMLIPDYSLFTTAIAAAGNQPRTCYNALRALTEQVVGVKLFTIMTLEGRNGTARRVYSNMPDVYPVSGTKPANETHWSRQVIDRRQIFVANDIKGIAAVFGDHELIRSLGCESVINVPIVVGGEVLGTINCLHEAGYYTPERVAASESLKLPAAACLLLARICAEGSR
jgi:GAF domain-containing protein